MWDGLRLALTTFTVLPVRAGRVDRLVAGRAMVAGTVHPLLAVAVTAAVAVTTLPAVPARPWHGPVAVLAGLATAGLLTRHAVRRLGGVTGDVLGACVETAATITLLTLSLG